MSSDIKYEVKAGFFDAINEDRTYSADDMNRPYRKLISNGVFATPKGEASDYLQVFAANNGMNVIVSAGYALIGDKWFENPSDVVITIPQNPEVLSRIDSIIAQVDKTQSGRVGNIVFRQGEASNNPVHPDINTENNISEFRLADIIISPSCVKITQDLITDCRGSDECPWVTSLIYQVDTSTLYAQWQAAYQKYYEDQEVNFSTWFEEMKTIFQESYLTNYCKKYENLYTTTVENEKTIEIGIQQYNVASILEVYVEGRILNKDEYTINGTNSITLTTPLSEIGTEVLFVVYRSMCATTEDFANLKGEKGDSGAIVFNSVADMKADTNLQAGDTCQTLGYYSANDGGAGLYRIVNDTTLADDGGSVHEIYSGLKAQLIIKNEINLKQFGAKGDGITDDTAAIQNAIDALSANFNYAKAFNNNVIEIISASYIITSTITMPVYVKLRPIGAVLFLSKVNDGACLRVTSGNTQILTYNSLISYYDQSYIQGGVVDGSCGTLILQKLNTSTTQYYDVNNETDSVGLEIRRHYI